MNEDAILRIKTPANFLSSRKKNLYEIANSTSRKRSHLYVNLSIFFGCQPILGLRYFLPWPAEIKATVSQETRPELTFEIKDCISLRPELVESFKARFGGQLMLVLAHMPRLATD